MASNLGFALLNLLTGVGQGYVGKKETLRKERLEDERTLGEREFRQGIFTQEQEAEDRRAREDRAFRTQERVAGEAREDKKRAEDITREDTVREDEQASRVEIARIQSAAELMRAQKAGEADSFNPHKMIADATTDYMIKLASGGMYEPEQINLFGQQFADNLTSIFKNTGILPIGPDIPPGGAGDTSTGDDAVDEAARLERAIRLRNVGIQREPDLMSNFNWRNLIPSDSTRTLR